MKLAIPSCFMTCLEWWCYEIVILLTVFLPNGREAIAAIAIVLNGDTFVVCSAGFSCSLCLH